MDEIGGPQGVCVGRYGFAVAAGFEPVSRAGAIYRVDASTHAEAPADVLRQLGAGAEILRTPDLGAGRLAIWIQAAGTRPRQRTLLGALAAGGHTLLLRSVADAGREAAAETLLRNVMEAYRPGVAQDFCVGLGSITSEPSRNERASVVLKTPSTRDLELAAEIQTTAAPREDHPLSDIDQQARAFASIGTQVRVLKNERRIVDGLQGYEGQVATSNKEEGAMLRYTWFHAGSAALADDPEIMLRASAPAAHRQLLDAAWSTMLTTFRRLPQGAR